VTVITIIRRYLGILYLSCIAADNAVLRDDKTRSIRIYTYITPCDIPYTRSVGNCRFNEKSKTAETRYSNLYKYSARSRMGRIGI